MTVTKDVWIKTLSGKEVRVQFGDDVIRKGQVVNIYFINDKKVAYLNQAADSARQYDAEVKQLVKKSFSHSMLMYLIFSVAFVVLSLMMGFGALAFIWWLGLGWVPVLGFVDHQNKKRVEAFWKAVYNAIIPLKPEMEKAAAQLTQTQSVAVPTGDGAAKFCTACGKPSVPEAKFCGGCGVPA